LFRFRNLSPWCHPAWLSGFRQRIRDHFNELIELGTAAGTIAPRGRLRTLYPDGLYLVLRSTLDFHLRDTSPGFERTDAFWEKSARFAFDLISSGALDSALDLARFLAPTTSARPAN
ncbi:MAG: hypothetical protein SNJ84_09510, partial [Verrucomicrobiia bacterium]